jgi:hypothetical protein
MCDASSSCSTKAQGDQRVHENRHGGWGGGGGGRGGVAPPKLSGRACADAGPRFSMHCHFLQCTYHVMLPSHGLRGATFRGGIVGGWPSPSSYAQPKLPRKLLAEVESQSSHHAASQCSQTRPRRCHCHAPDLQRQRKVIDACMVFIGLMVQGQAALASAGVTSPSSTLTMFFHSSRALHGPCLRNSTEFFLTACPLPTYHSTYLPIPKPIPSPTHFLKNESRSDSSHPASPAAGRSGSGPVHPLLHGRRPAPRGAA